MFEFIYRWFQGMYGENLADILAGFNCEMYEEGNIWRDCYTEANTFTTIGIVTLVVAAAFFVLYYYIINSARFNKWWHWLIVMLIVAVCGLFIGYGMADSHLVSSEEGVVPAYEFQECLAYVCQDGVFTDTIAFFSTWSFGIANSIVAAMFFIILSFVGKWGSKSCRRTPF